MRYEVRELPVGGILDQTLFLVRDHWRMILKIASVLAIPYALVMALILHFFVPQQDMTSQVNLDPEMYTTLIGKTFIGAGIAMLLGVIQYVFVLPQLAAPLIYAMANALMGRTVTAGEALRATIRIYPRLVVVCLLQHIMAYAGVFLCLIPGVLVILYFFIADAVIVLENSPITASFGRSARLMNGHKTRVFILMLALGVASSFTGMMPLLFPNSLLGTMLQTLSGLVATTLMLLSTVVVYFSARCRIENLDLDLLINRVDPMPQPQRAVL